MDMRIEFTGGSQVEARFGRHTVITDQSVEDGGGDSAPSPFDLFLAALGTCAGYYVLKFCTGRGIPVEGLSLTQNLEVDPKTHRLMKVAIRIHTPPGFPEKYRDAVERAAGQCTVKRTLFAPPEVVVTAGPD